MLAEPGARINGRRGVHRGIPCSPYEETEELCWKPENDIQVKVTGAPGRNRRKPFFLAFLCFPFKS